MLPASAPPRRETFSHKVKKSGVDSSGPCKALLKPQDWGFKELEGEARYTDDASKTGYANYKVACSLQKAKLLGQLSDDQQDDRV